MSKNPLDDYFAEKEKTAAAPMGFMKTMRAGLKPAAVGNSLAKGLLTAGSAAAGAGMVAGAAWSGNKLYQAATKARDFRGMLAADGELARMHKNPENTALVNTMFSTFRTFNPEFSAHPVVAAQFVKQMVMEPGSAASIALNTHNDYGGAAPRSPFAPVAAAVQKRAPSLLKLHGQQDILPEQLGD